MTCPSSHTMRGRAGSCSFCHPRLTLPPAPSGREPGAATVSDTGPVQRGIYNGREGLTLFPGIFLLNHHVFVHTIFL